MLFANIVEEVQKMLEETKYSAEVCYMDEDKNEVEQALVLCRERKPMGILFLGGNPSNFERNIQADRSAGSPDHKQWKRTSV